jgi:hypothetical protein
MEAHKGNYNEAPSSTSGINGPVVALQQNKTKTSYGSASGINSDWAYNVYYSVLRSSASSQSRAFY